VLLAFAVFPGPLACAPATRPAAVEAASTTREEDERAVWRVLIDSARSGPGTTVVVSENTAVVRDLPDPGWLRHVEGDFPYAAIADLEPVARTSIPLAPRLGTLPDVRWMTAASRDQIFAGEVMSSPARFEARYPGARGYLAFTRVGFDAERRHAAVGVSSWCGPLCGSFTFKLLRREATGWKMVGQFTTVVS
jgi:hypothetical protein